MDDDFNIKGECDCCGKEKENCYLDDLCHDDSNMLICKKCWDYINR